MAKFQPVGFPFRVGTAAAAGGPPPQSAAAQAKSPPRPPKSQPFGTYYSPPDAAAPAARASAQPSDRQRPPTSPQRLLSSALPSTAAAAPHGITIQGWAPTDPNGYLSRHGVPQMLTEFVQALVDAHPDSPAVFAKEYFSATAAEAASGGSVAAHQRREAMASGGDGYASPPMSPHGHYSEFAQTRW